MDHELQGLLAAAVVGDSDVENWFATVETAHTEADGDWEEFVRQLTDGIRADFMDAARSFLDNAEGNGKLELVGRLFTDVDDVPAAYAKARAFARMIETYGEDWAGWNGTEPNWTEYRDWLYEATRAEGSDMYDAAVAALDPLNDMAFEQRADRLTALGFTIEANESTIRATVDEVYSAVVGKVIEIDPGFHAQLSGNSELADTIYAETDRRLR